MADGFNETPIRGKHRHNADPVDDTAAAALVAVATADNPAYVEGNMVGLSTDLAGRVRVVLSDPSEDSGAGAAFDVDVTDRDERRLGVVSWDAGTEARDAERLADLRDSLIESELTQHTATRETLTTEFDATRDALTDEETATRALLTAEFLATRTNDTDEATATRDLIGGTRDTLVTSLTDLRDTLSTNLEQITPQVRGADVSDDNPLPVNIQTNPGALYDTGLLTADNLAPGASVELDSDDIDAGLTGRLVELTAASSVRIKVVLRRMGTGARDERVFFVDPTSSSLIYTPVDRDAITAAAGGRFRMTITNMDNLRTAAVYGSLTHVEF